MKCSRLCERLTRAWTPLYPGYNLAPHLHSTQWPDPPPVPWQGCCPPANHLTQLRFTVMRSWARA